jgi:hypothetical protein
MGSRRGRFLKLAPACAALIGLAAAASGCGVEEHPNEARPQPPTRVSVAVTESSITVRPSRIAIGPEPTQQIPQNAHAGQPQVSSDRPLDVTLVAANLTDVDSRLEVRGRRDARSQPLVANGNVSMQTSLPTGVYTIAAADIPAARPAKLVVGPYRSSSRNDVLLP